ARLRFPVLFAISAVLFLATLVFPDPIPFADELLLGLATALLASWRRRDADEAARAQPAVNSARERTIPRPPASAPGASSATKNDSASPCSPRSPSGAAGRKPKRG